MLENLKKELSENLPESGAFRPFPKYGEREKWQSLPEDMKNFFVKKGEEYSGWSWPYAPASMYMDYTRNGNRSRYEGIIFNKRRLPLQYLVMAECCEGKGRFTDDIINGIWTTLDEASWVIPAHNNSLTGENLVLPLPETLDPDLIYIDLFAAECGALISWVYYLLDELLDRETEIITKRMLGELEKRIFAPFLKHRNFWWMGFFGNTVNNWNPWIISNILTAAVFACGDGNEKEAIILKAFDCLDYFIKGYAPDGGCDEGPVYWGSAGASLYDCLDILADITGGKTDLRKNEFVRNVCSYIYKTHISGDYYVNYADASVFAYPDAQLIYRMGKSTGDGELVRMGCSLYNEKKRNGTVWKMDGVGCKVYRKTKNFLCDAVIAAEKDAYCPLARSVWFDGIEVMCARMTENDPLGLFLSAKGGNNGESHNHNDVGSFVIYCDGKPAVIDIGSGQYTALTFSSRRYEIPHNNSFNHNLPVIGGYGQLEGIQHAAENVIFQNGESQSLSMELKGLYPKEAGIESWKRTFTFDRKNEYISVEDEFSLASEREVSLVLMTAAAPVSCKSGIEIPADGGSAVCVQYPSELIIGTETFETDYDELIEQRWGKALYRNVFKFKNPVKSGKARFIFRKKPLSV